MNAVLAVAGKELRDGLRNRWALAITVVFAVLAVGLAAFGSVASGQVGFAPLSTTIVSLASLAVFLIPLIALMLAYDSVVGEEQQGTLLLLLTYPLSRIELLTGKFLGHSAVLGLSTLVGFGAAGGVIAALSPQVTVAQLLPPLTLFIVSSVLLGWAFIALAYLISVSTREKGRAAGLALVVWFLFVLVFDLGLLAILVGTGGAVDAGLFRGLMLLNPTDVFRLVNLTGFEAVAAQAGLMSVAEDAFHPVLLLAVLAGWVVAPFGLALWLFHRRRA